ncbi:glycosyltransferase [Halorubrum sp. DTA98]|uniref:glycosyltransferase n=1 Tax=Halorubrum sp. DTA98 TaxID=3402163 RepID=UPI003AAB9FC6
MNVLYYLDWFPKLSQSFILNEIYYLSKRGHNVAVFSLNRPDTNVEHDELDDIDIDIAYADAPSITSVPRTLVGSLFDDRSSYESPVSGPKRRLGTRFLTKQCLDFVDTLEYDLDHVHAHFLRWNKIPAATVAKDLGVTSSLTTHAYDLYASPDETTLKTVCDSFDTILTISEYNERFLNVEVNPDAEVKVVRMGLRTEKFDPSMATTGKRLLTISRFVEKKGIEYALLAVADCVDEHPELDYRLIGSGPRRERYETLIERLGIEDNVTFLGSVSDETLIEELDRARAFVLPCVVAKDGDRDGIPVAIMEAMAMETPVVSTYVSGIPELIEDGENGFLCSERSVQEISSAMRKCISQKTQLLENGARETVIRQHDLDTVGPSLTSIFD